MRPTSKAHFILLAAFGLLSCDKQEKQHFAATEEMLTKLVVERAEAKSENNQLVLKITELQKQIVVLDAKLQEKDQRIRDADVLLTELKQKEKAEITDLKKQISKFHDIELASFQKCERLLEQKNYRQAHEMLEKHLSDFPHGEHTGRSRVLLTELEKNPLILTASKFDQGTLSSKDLASLIENKSRREVLALMGEPVRTRTLSKPFFCTVDEYESSASGKTLKVRYVSELAADPLILKPTEFYHRLFKDPERRSYQEVTEFLGKPDVDIVFGQYGSRQIEYFGVGEEGVRLSVYFMNDKVESCQHLIGDNPPLVAD